MNLDHAAYLEALQVLSKRREDVWGLLRPIVRSLIDAAQAVAAAAEKAGLPRRMVYAVLLYGGSWAYLLERLVHHFWHLGVLYPLLVIAIGEDAADACRDLAAGDLGAQVGVSNMAELKNMP